MSTRVIPSVIAVAVAGLLGCVGTLTDRNEEPAAAPDAGTANPQTTARIAFERDVEPLLTMTRPKGACIICHSGTTCPTGGGSCFLGDDPLNHYGSLINAQAVGNGTPLITELPATSRFLQRGDHNGNAFCTGPGTPYAACTQNEVQLISDWINLEAGGL